MAVPEDFSDWLIGQRSALLRSALLLTGDLAAAEDLVQDAAIKVAARWDRLRDQQPTAYARRILYRDHASWWRRRRETPTAVDQDQPIPGPDHEQRSVLLGVLAGLPPGQRAVIVLRYFDDLTERQTADLLGVSVGTVKSQAHAALTRLRSHGELRDLVGEETRP
jgi:RNA polymerase sigma-70 factor (sigma-E family)